MLCSAQVLGLGGTVAWLMVQNTEPVVELQVEVVIAWLDGHSRQLAVATSCQFIRACAACHSVLGVE